MRLKSYDNRPITPNPRRGWAWAQRLQAQQAHQRFQRAFESSDMTQWRRAAAFAGNRHKHRSWQASSKTPIFHQTLSRSFESRNPSPLLRGRLLAIAQPEAAATLLHTSAVFE